MKRNGATIWAATISISIHLIGLSVLALTLVSPAKQTQNHYSPTARFSRSQITYLMNTTQTSPKPKIKEPPEQITQTISSLSTPYKTAVEIKDNPEQLTVAGQFSGAVNSGESMDFAELPVSQNVSGDNKPQAVVPQSRTEFFGSVTEKRKICYLVDCSGSMQGLFSRVKKELYKSIDSLEQDQYFAVIFFGNNALLGFENGKLIRASRKNKQAAYDFISSVQPTGQGDGLAALNRALNVRDNFGSAPQIVYFLTDGFELANDNPQSATRTADENLEQQFAEITTQNSAKTRINPIAFWPQDEDKKMLQTIAEKSGGELVVIMDENQLKKTDDKK